ncbi:MAG: hypothetical protein ACRCTZ_07800 [Sarcina sp.]
MSELKRVKDIFTEIQNVSSIKAKEYILKQNADNKLFKECLKFLLDSNVVTGLSTKKMNKDVLLVNETFVDIRDAFKYLQTHNTGTDHDIAIIKSYCYFQGELEDFCKDIFTKKLKLGIDTKVVNRVYPNFIREFNVQLATSYEKCKNKFENQTIIITEKIDGQKLIAIKENNLVEFFSRQGKLVTGLIDIESEFENMPEGVYDGELVSIDETSDSSETYKETMKRASKKGDKLGLKYQIYDYVENVNDFYKGKDNTPAIDRKCKINKILNGLNLVYVEYLKPWYVGEDTNKIEYFIDVADNQGKEGICVNVANAPYVTKRTPYLAKCKSFKTADIFVKDIFEGSGKLKGMLGGLKCEFLYKGELCNVEVGTGFSEYERKLIYEDPKLVVGKIVTIKFFEISKNTSLNKHSLRFPSWKGVEYIRTDKVGINDTNID